MRILIKIVYYAVTCLNLFPATEGVSSTIGPRTIIVGDAVIFGIFAKLSFGIYVQTREDHDNSMAPRIIGAISLCLVGNTRGGY